MLSDWIQCGLLHRFQHWSTIQLILYFLHFTFLQVEIHRVWHLLYLICKYSSTIYSLNSYSGCHENVCDTDYETEYSYIDNNDQFQVQNVVKKPGCETFDIDFGDKCASAGPRRKPELSRKSSGVRKVSKPSSAVSLKSPVKNKPRRHLRKVEKDQTNNAIRRVMTDKGGKTTRPTASAGKESRPSSGKKPTTQGTLNGGLNWLSISLYSYFILYNLETMFNLYLLFQVCTQFHLQNKLMQLSRCVFCIHAKSWGDTNIPPADNIQVCCTSAGICWTAQPWLDILRGAAAVSAVLGKYYTENFNSWPINWNSKPSI